ncbi:putative actin-crosslinking [Helianthus annuus]|nr:putative actin-crosslinking [Helianthus annuus]
MEFFNQAKVVRLRSHLNKFLVADDDEQTVHQSRNGSSVRARWTVELVEGRNHVIRLKSCSSGKYLTPSNDPFLTGMTGKKVVQDIQANKRDTSIEWEPIKEGGLVKLRAKGGKFLRGNGGTPPWRNSVTHDVPQRTATQDWVLWDVDVVDIAVLESQESFASDLSPMSSFSSRPDIERVKADGRASPVSYPGSPLASASPVSYRGSPRASGRQSGMEFFSGAKTVRLKGYHNKYLAADDDQETVRQSTSGSSSKVRWTVEYIDGNPNAIRLKSCHGLYLSATNEPFLLGMTGKKVQQYSAQSKPDHTTEWEPIRENASHVKLRTCDGKFLRANGGTPPWRNSITHDVPHRTATQDWVLWSVDVVDISLSDTESVMSSLSSFSSVVDNFSGSPERIGSPDMRSLSPHTGSPSTVLQDRERKLSSGMDFFRNAKTVRLRSHHDKYLLADSDRENVSQDRKRTTTKEAIWTVEFVPGFNNVIRLKSTYGKYLTASEDQKIMGVSGRKVVQTLPQKLNSSVDWEPIRDGFQTRLKTRYGNYLRANGGLPPWRNSITHDIPSRHLDEILWDVETVEARIEDPPSPQPETIDPEPDLSSSSFCLRTPKSGPAEVNDLWERPSIKKEGRTVYYKVADDDGNLEDDAYEEASFSFNGRGVEDLAQDLEELTGLDDIIICSRNSLNGKLFPLRLALPPNNKTIHVVVVPSTSKVAREF